MEVGSNLMPYMDPETFTREVKKCVLKEAKKIGLNLKTNINFR